MTFSALLCPLFGLTLLHFAAVTLSSNEVCYGKYGCFNHNPPFNRPLIPLPQPPQEMGMTYYLLTRADPFGKTIINDHDVTKLQASSYDGSKRTVIIVHGWVENPETSAWIANMKKALVEKEDVNVIVAGWKEGASKLYTTSVANTRLVGSMIAELIKFLNQETKNSPASFHLIGLSLGAHVAGYVGRRLQSVKLGRITGLDPAGPYYIDVHTDVRLDKTDADFVDVIHTGASLVGLGTTTKSGHLDFWPNSGNGQRGCEASKVGLLKVMGCDHLRAANLYVDSIASQCPFRSYRCENWDKFTHGNCMTCNSNGCPETGHNAMNYKGLADGNFYLYTNEEPPYCVHRYAFVTFKTSGRFGAGGRNPRIRIHGTKGNTGEIQLEKRLLPAGSNEKFVAPIKADLGSLTSIDVWHFNLLNIFDVWRPDKVTVEFVDNQKRYTACFKGTIVRRIAINKKLQQGDLYC